MTDTSYPPALIHAHDPVAPLLANHITVASAHLPRALGAEDVQDDDGQISCFCGFSDDDGNTVACDSCNRWQHTICYYPQYEGRDLPEELQHYCVDCRPQSFDASAAQSRQRLKREQQESLLSAKRQNAKTHKKKAAKDAPTTAYTNGWPLDKVRSERNSASPRDQPPPAKRPKTSHPASDSTVPTAKGHSRKRNASSVVHNRSLLQSPDQPIDQYSPDFLRCYNEDEWTVTHANLHNDIAVTNALSEWLRAPDDEFRNTHGTEKREVLLRWDGELDDIPGKAQIEIREMRDTRRSDDASTPAWKTVTVKEPVASGAYIGELKGHVGFMSQYKDDPGNRWPILRHPEPFVFFHQPLQIYIDARNEGTQLRYVRRSCRPNARLQILVTDQTDYRFCFMATEQIDPGMEVAIAWDTAESIPRSANGISPRDMDILSAWVSSVLSNCGPCACDASQGECAMSRFDRRRDYYDDTTSAAKTTKKKKKAAHHISPSNSYPVNSRSGSEARKNDPDDDRSDSRSASASNRGSASRDITPNTHYSTNGSLSAVPEMSERERKKLAKEEEMFRRQAEEQSGKSRKKRSSGGSNLNTPSATSSRPLTFVPPGPRYADAGTSKQVGLPSAKPSVKPKRPTSNKQTAKRARALSRPKPDYVDASTQVDLAAEEAQRRAQQPRSNLKVISTHTYLLRYLAQKSARRNGFGKMNQCTPSPAEPKAEAHALTGPTAADNSNNDEHDQDVVMSEAEKDVDQMGTSTGENLQPQDTSASMEAVATLEPTAVTQVPSSPPHDETGPTPGDNTQRRVEMRLSMPPPTNPLVPSGPLSAVTPTSATALASASASSITGLAAPIFSPAVAAAVTPSPARKKLSLSDYTKRSKAKDKDPDTKAERDSSPASTASGPVVPPLQAHSSGSDTKTNDGSVEEDSKMEDVAVE